MAPMAMPVEPEQHQDSAFFKRPTPDAKAAQNGSLAAHLNSLYEVLERPIGSRRRLRVVTLGAGYSGLMMAILFNEKLKDANAELTIYERNPDLGGTWLENRYPGCRYTPAIQYESEWLILLSRQVRYPRPQLLIQLLPEPRLAELLRHFAADLRLHEGCCEQVQCQRLHEVPPLRQRRSLE